MKDLEALIKNAAKIEIESGEGTGPGTTEVFTGRRTLRAIERRLTKERCGGDRWAIAIVDGQRLL